MEKIELHDEWKVQQVYTSIFSEDDTRKGIDVGDGVMAVRGSVRHVGGSSHTMYNLFIPETHPLFNFPIIKYQKGFAGGQKTALNIYTLDRYAEILERSLL